MGQIVAAIEGLAEACRALEFPVISGNVSLYNETSGAAIPPTPAIGGVGLIDDLKQRAGLQMQERDVLILIGETKGHLGASLLLREIARKEEGAPPPVDLALERRTGDLIRGLIKTGIVRTAHDLSDGGLACAAAEMALASKLGVTLGNTGKLADLAFAFGEDQARYLLAVSPDQEAAVYAAAQKAGVPAEPVGVAGGSEFAFGDEAVSLAALAKAHEDWLPTYMSKAA
jgi:phosphoribosylformylglycinamidine synthase